VYGRTHRIHLIGIGGSGMCGIAEVLLNMGYQVSGSDLRESENTDRLVHLGGRVFIGHAASNIERAQVVVYSTAVKNTNDELRAAVAAGIPVSGRAEMLAELIRMKNRIAVGGTHGKTTTTSLVATLIARGGLDPTIVVGGRLHAIGSNARLGHGRFLVAEADESDGSFLRLSPAMTVITNIDHEHLDHYSSMDELRQAFIYFANRVPFYGVSVLCIDDPLVREIIPEVTKRTLTYGFSEDADLRATDVRVDAAGSHFIVHVGERLLGEVHLQLHGRHNVLNALAALAVGREIEIGFG
jgi:UDP-N-acetylmuramate--alanine ligase